MRIWRSRCYLFNKKLCELRTSWTFYSLPKSTEDGIIFPNITLFKLSGSESGLITGIPVYDVPCRLYLEFLNYYTGRCACSSSIIIVTSEWHRRLVPYNIINWIMRGFFFFFFSIFICSVYNKRALISSYG